MQDRCSLIVWFAVWDSGSAVSFSACGFFDLRLCAMHLLLFVLCLDLWFCFSLCKRIFNCCLRSFALARATSPCQSPRAGPQRFLVWVRVCWCCALEYEKQAKNRGSVPPLRKVFFYECRNHYRIYKTRSAPEILRCLRHRLRCQTAHHRR